MKVSEITVSNVADYLRLNTGEYTEAEMMALLNAAKSFIRSYTGLQDNVILGEVIGTGDGTTKSFSLSNTNIISGTQLIYVDGIQKTATTDYIIDNIKGKITFIDAPIQDLIITADYSVGIDAFEDFYIVIMILCQDMYDNRSMYVEKSNLNKVVDTILGMHCRNLL